MDWHPCVYIQKCVLLLISSFDGEYCSPQGRRKIVPCSIFFIYIIQRRPKKFCICYVTVVTVDLVVWVISTHCWLEGSLGRRLSICLGKQAEVYKIQTQDRPEKYVSICFVIHAALRESSLCWQNISIGTTVSKGVEWYRYPAHCGTVLCPWTCWGTRKWNLQQAR